MEKTLPTNPAAVIKALAEDGYGRTDEYILVRTDDEDRLHWMSVNEERQWFYTEDIIEFEVLFEGVPN